MVRSVRDFPYDSVTGLCRVVDTFRSRYVVVNGPTKSKTYVNRLSTIRTVRKSVSYKSMITNQCGRNRVHASCRSVDHQCLVLQEQVLGQSSPKESKLAFPFDDVEVDKLPYIPLSSSVCRDNVI